MSAMPDDPNEQPQTEENGDPVAIPITVPIAIGLTADMNVSATQVSVTVTRTVPGYLGNLSVFYTTYSGSNPGQNLAGQTTIQAPFPPNTTVTSILPLPVGALNIGFFSILVIDHSDNKGGSNGFSVS